MSVLGLVLAGIATLSLGILSLFQRRRDQIVSYFFATMVGTSLWSFGIAVFLVARDAQTALTAAGVYYAAAALIAVATLLVSLSLGAKQPVRRQTAFLVSVPFVLIATALIVSPGILIQGVTIGESDIHNTASLVPWAYGLYGVYFLLYFGGALAVMLRRFIGSRGRTRLRLRYVLSAYSVAGAIGMLFNLILPALGNYDYIWVGPLGLLVFVPIVYIAIIRYGLFDVKLAVSRTIVYVLTLSVIASLYVLITTTVSEWLISQGLAGERTGMYYDPYGIDIAATLLAVFLFQPLRRFFDRLTNGIFYRDRYNKDEFYAELNKALTETINLRSLLLRTSRLIARTLNTSQAFLFVYREGQRYTSAGTDKHSRLPLQDALWLNDIIGQRKSPERPIVADYLSDSTNGTALRRFMVSHRLAVILPLVRADVIVGYLCLGERKAGSYAARDMVVLTTIANELVIAVQNALSIEEVRELNDTLQQRIDDATKELRTSNAQLRRLDEAKDEFISMASHQLRTPLTSVKGYIDMMLEGDAGEITPMQQKFLAEAFASSERMVHLINDFLNVSRLQTGKFSIEKRPTDLVRIVRQELDGLKISASQHDLKFEFVPPHDMPRLMLDEAKIRQVIMNFADNALYYSRPGTTIFVRLQQVDNAVEFTVQDTGIGVPKDEQAQLFTKFYRASNARKQRPDGTGVGLYLAKRVITGHSGSVVFESEEGKGSTFGFRLPLEKLRVRDDADKLD